MEADNTHGMFGLPGVLRLSSSPETEGPMTETSYTILDDTRNA